MVDYPLLEELAREFIARVERGEVRSSYTYMAFREALGLPLLPTNEEEEEHSK